MSGNALVVGPLVLPYPMLLLFAAVSAAFWIGSRIAGPRSVEVESVLWKALLVGLIVARFVFVLEFRSVYFASPIDILDIRDGGWSATAGFVGAWLYALSRQNRLAALRKPLQYALLTGSCLWLIGSVALAVRPHTGQELPSTGFVSLDGSTVRMAQFKGKPTVINLWATWCPPCVREMPVLIQAQARLPGVNFVFLNQGESPDQVVDWLRARNFSLNNMLLDSRRQAAAEFKQSALPTTLFFNAKGYLQSIRVGELSAATLTERLQKLDP